MAAAGQQVSPSDQAQLAFAENEKAKARKTNVEIAETLTDIEKKQAETQETIVDTEIKKIEQIGKIVAPGQQL